VVVLVTTLLVGSGFLPTPFPQAAIPSEEIIFGQKVSVEYVPDQVLVKFRKSSSKTFAGQALGLSAFASNASLSLKGPVFRFSKQLPQEFCFGVEEEVEATPTPTPTITPSPIPTGTPPPAEETPIPSSLLEEEFMPLPEEDLFFESPSPEEFPAQILDIFRRERTADTPLPTPISEIETIITSQVCYSVAELEIMAPAKLPSEALSYLKKVKQQQQALVIDGFGLDRWQILNIGNKQTDPRAIARELSKHPSVEYAEANLIVRAMLIPNDDLFNQLWGIQKIKADEIWDTTQGEGVVVAISDSGIDYTHEDLVANIWTNSGEIPNNGVDDDNNGFVDDIRGWDFNNYDNDPSDDWGHGTHVAGIVAAVGNNNIGVIGVAPRVKLMPVGGLGADGSGWVSNLADGIRYAADNGADVINMSWGGAGQSTLLNNVLDYANSLGVVTIAAAGNDNVDAAGQTPANHSGTIAVAATTQTDSRASTSNYGSTVDVAAPGVNVISTMSDDSGIATTYPQLKVANGYYRLSGTSMAAPHVAGVAALVMASNPGLDIEDIYERLRTRVDSIITDKFIGGRINAVKAVDGPTEEISLPFFDNFNRSAPTPNSLGSSWVNKNGSFGIANNKAVKLSGTSASPALVTLEDISVGDVDVSADINFSTTEQTGMGLVARYQGSAADGSGDQNFYMAYVYKSASNLPKLYIFKRTASSWINLSSSSEINTTSGTLNLKVTDNSLEASFGGETITATDNTFATGGVGTILTFGSNNTFDDFSAEAAEAVGENPNLTIEGNPSIQTTLEEGEVQIFRAIIRNKGDAAAASSKTRFFIDNVSIGDNNTGSLAVNATELEQKTWTAVAGKHTLKVCADIFDEVDESNEDDNCSTKDFIVKISLPFSDNFNRSDSSDLGSFWINKIGSFGIINNKAKRLSGSPAIATVAGLSVGDVDVSVKIDFSTTDVTEVTGVALIARYRGDYQGSGDQNFYRASIRKTISTLPELTLWRNWGGIWKLLASSAPINVSSGTLNFKVVGNTLEASFGGTTITATEDYFAFVVGGVGMRFSVGDIVTFDDFRAEVPDGEENQAPEFQPTPNQTVTVGDNLIFQIEATDPDEDVLTYSETSLPQGAFFDADTRTFSWTPTPFQVGSHTASFSVTDGDLSDTLDVQIAVVAETKPNLIIQELKITGDLIVGQTLTFKATVKNDGTATAGFSKIRFFIDNLSIGQNNTASLAVNATELEQKNWTAAVGNHTLKACTDILNVVDESKENDNCKTRNFAVSAVLEPDLITQNLQVIGDHIVGQTLTLRATVKNNGDATAGSSKIRFFMDNISIWLTNTTSLAVNATELKEKTWTATVGNHTFKVCADVFNDVSESNENNNCETKSFTIVQPAQNQPPVFNSVSDKTVVAGNILTFQISATDPDNDPPTYSSTQLPTGASFNASTRTFSWTPTIAQIGNHQAKFEVSDPDGLIDDLTVNIEVEQPNRSPEFDSISNQSVEAAKTLTFTIHATDPDDDPLTYSSTQLPSGSSFNVNTRTFSWAPTTAQIGNHQANFEVSDPEGLADDLTVNIEVTPPQPTNQAPDFQAVSNQTVIAGSNLIFQIEATDPDGDSLTYSATNLPQGAVFNVPNRTFSWTPTALQVGNHTASFSVTDGQLSDALDVEITVAPRPKPNLIIDGALIIQGALEEGEQLTFKATVKNNGNADADFSYTRFFIDDSLIGDSLTGLLDVNATKPAQKAWTAILGSHTLKVCADVLDEVDESDEGDNCSARSFVVGATSKPDLIIDGEPSIQGVLEEGETLTFRATVKNSGGGAAGSSRTRFFIDNSSIGDGLTGALAVNATELEQKIWIAISGSHTLKVCADIANVVNESNEGDNCVTKSFVIEAPLLPFTDNFFRSAPTPNNLGSSWVNKSGSFGIASNRAKRLSGSPGIATVAGLSVEDVEVSAIIWVEESTRAGLVARYQGSAAGSGNQNYYVAYVIESPGLQTSKVTLYIYKRTANSWVSLASSAPINISSNTTSGGLNFKVIGNTLEASFKGKTIAAVDNSFATGGVGIIGGFGFIADNFTAEAASGGSPNLIIDGNLVILGTFEEGETLTLRATVKNNGDGVAGSSQMRFFIDNSSIGNNLTSVLAVNATELAQRTWTATPGNHTLKVCADIFNNVDESDESDNCKTEDFVISTGDPDLITQNLQIIGNHVVGQALTLKAIVGNNGDVTANSSKTRFFIDNSSIGDNNTGSLAVNSTEIEQKNWTATVGSHTLKVCADILDEVDESDENNNCSTQSFTINEPPLVFFDNFNRANTSNNLGSSWVGKVGSIRIFNNKARVWNSPGLATVKDFPVGDVEVSAEVVAGTSLVGLVARYQGSASTGTGNSNYYMADVAREFSPTGVESSKLKILERTTSSWTTLASSPGIIATSGTLNFKIVGNTLEASFGGTTITATDNTFATGEVGIYGGAFGINFDDFRAETPSVNNAPEFDSISDQSVEAGKLLNFTIHATDSDDDPLTYSSTQLPPGSSFNVNTRTFSWTPTTAQVGIHQAKFEVSDPDGLIDDLIVNIEVQEPQPTNQAPDFQAVANQTITSGSNLIFQIEATDSDGDSLTYSATSLPQGAVFNVPSRTFSWTPTTPQVGAHTASFSVTDGQLSDTLSVQITVTQPGQVGGKIYWSEGNSSGKIITAELNGANPQEIITGQSFPRGLDIDKNNQKLYWINLFSRINRSNLDGTNIEAVVNKSGLGGIAVDSAGGKIYYTSVNEDVIYRANLDGSNQQQLLSYFDLGGKFANPQNIVLHNGKMYWFSSRGPQHDSSGSGRIQRANFDGSGLEDVLLGSQQIFITSLAIKDNKIYIANSVRDKIHTVNLDGSGVSDLITGIESPSHIYIDSPQNKIYWADISTAADIYRANLNGSNVEMIIDLSSRPGDIVVF